MANKRKNKKKKGLQSRWGLDKRWPGGLKQDLHREKEDPAEKEKMIPVEEPDKGESASQEVSKKEETAKAVVKKIPAKEKKEEKPQEPAAVPAEEKKEEKPQESAAVPAEEKKEEKPQEPAAVPAEDKKKEKPQEPAAVPTEEKKEEKQQESAAVSTEEKKEEKPQETAAVPTEEKKEEKPQEPAVVLAEQKDVSPSEDGEGEDEDMQRKLFLQYNNLEFSDSVMFDAAVNDYCTWAGISPEEITSVNLYVKPEEGKAYYVINDDPDKNGSIDL